MTDIKLTAARVDVLRAVAAGKVIHHLSMRLDRPERNTWDGRLVTPAVRYLDQAGLVAYQMEFGRITAPWQLTEAGKQWLADNAEEEVMTDVDLTAVSGDNLHRILIRADNMDLWQETDGTTREYDHEYFGFTDYLRDVTELADAAAEAGLIVRYDTGRQWSTTDAGERWLAENQEAL